MSKRFSKKERAEKPYKISLTRQVTIIFASIMAGTILICLLVNTFFLEKYYLYNKEKTLFTLYDSMVAESMSDVFISDSFDILLQKYSTTHNVSIAVLTSLYQPVLVYSNESEDRILSELIDNLGGTIKADRVIKETDDYILILKNDSRMGTDYVELMGVLQNGVLFLMRTPVESLKVSAGIANRFLLYVGAGAVIVSAVFIYIFTRRISKPILEIADISEKVSTMNFESRYIGKNKTEIGHLGKNINKMSDALKKSILDLKEANEELQHDNELKTKIDEMRKEFISNVSHELKTPIALIQGYAEGLKEGVNEPDERDYYCDVIMDESSKMNSMVKNLLTLNQLESGEDVLSYEYFDLALLVRNYIQSSEILTKQSDITVSLNAPVDCFVYADEFKIEEVFMNYFTNAIHHCDFNTEKRIDVFIEKAENEIKVNVHNTSLGIPEDSIPHLWDKFYKVDKARTREYGGSGVGLSIVKAIMEAHKGKYGVYNTNNGVCFWFSLPVYNNSYSEDK